ncbi:MAG: hypothetical protein JWO94_2234 [Verrucomicrobiaceae bacterium]|nr:hypothetical protein [Verrucomicrobiaceae bacterium]
MSSGPPSPFSSQHSSSGERFEDAKRIEVRPRAGGPPKPAEQTDAVEVMLNFSCPACLEMLIAPKTSAQSSVQCPECSAWVMPPKLASLASGAGANSKTALPPPRKTGTQALRQ